MSTAIRSVCVFCSSSDKVDAAYFEAARQLGRLLARDRYTLVYGGGKIGLMGALALATREHGGRVVGIIPRSMVDQELAYQEADELILTDTMRQRKATMDERADAFIVLPGGFGTLEELLEALTLRQLRYHVKPILMVNLNGFFDRLLAVFEQLIEDRFAKPHHRSSYQVVPDPQAAVTFLQRCDGQQMTGGLSPAPDQLRRSNP